MHFPSFGFLLHLLLVFIFFTFTQIRAVPTSATSTNKSLGLSGVGKCENSPIGKLESVTVTGCDVTPCTFEKGGKYSLFIELTPKGDSKYLTFNATASIFGFKLPLLTGDVCENLISREKCPIKDGRKYMFKLDVNLNKYVPSIQKLLVTASVFDEFQKMQACASVPVRVV